MCSFFLSTLPGESLQNYKPSAVSQFGPVRATNKTMGVKIGIKVQSADLLIPVMFSRLSDVTDIKAFHTYWSLPLASLLPELRPRSAKKGKMIRYL